MPVWIDIEEKLGATPSTHPSRLRFLDRVNFFGQVVEKADTQGRVLIPARLRETAAITGDVDVLGQYNYLDAWNHDRWLTRLQRDAHNRRRREGALGVRHLMTHIPVMTAEVLQASAPRAGRVVRRLHGRARRPPRALPAGASRVSRPDRDPTRSRAPAKRSRRGVIAWSLVHADYRATTRRSTAGRSPTAGYARFSPTPASRR